MDNTVIIVGVVSAVIWFFISLLTQNKGMNRSLVSAIMFAVWYILFYFVGGYLFTLFNNMNNPDINRYTIGIGAVVLWFLFSLVFQRKSMKSTLKSTGIFAVYVVLAEVLYAILKNMKF